MSYYIQYEKISGTVVLPEDFIYSNDKESLKLQDEITVLKDKIKDLDSISARVYEDTSKKIKENEDKIIEMNRTGFINKYDFWIFPSEKDAYNSDKVRKGAFFLSGKDLLMITSEGENASFAYNGGGYELHSLGYTNSNGGWVGKIFEVLAHKFESTISFSIITEEGTTDTVHICYDDNLAVEALTIEIQKVVSSFDDLDPTLQAKALNEVLKRVS